MLAGGELFFGGRTPAKPKWSEVMIFLGVFLRQGSPFPEENPCRRRVLCQLAQFRRANVRRRRMHCGRPNSGEAEVVGGNDFLDDFLRQGSPFPEENPCRRRELCQLSQFQRATVRRRKLFCERLSSGEATVVGGNNLFGFSPPAGKPLTGTGTT